MDVDYAGVMAASDPHENLRNDDTPSRVVIERYREYLELESEQKEPVSLALVHFRGTQVE